MYLKNTKTGEVFCFNERLAAKAGYVKLRSLDAKEDAADSPEAAAQAAQAAAAKKQAGPRAGKK